MMEVSELFARHRNKIINAAIIILALVVSNKIHQKQVQEMASLREKKEAEVTKSGVLEDIRQLEEKIEPYKNLLVKRDASAVINTMSNLAKEAGVKILSIRPEPEQRFPDYTKFSYDLMISAPSYHTLGNFVSRIESFRDVYVFDTLDVRPESQTQGGLSASIKLSLLAVTD